MPATRGRSARAVGAPTSLEVDDRHDPVRAVDGPEDEVGDANQGGGHDGPPFRVAPTGRGATRARSGACTPGSSSALRAPARPLTGRLRHPRSARRSEPERRPGARCTVTSTVPPMASTRDRTMYRPMPVPLNGGRPRLCLPEPVEAVRRLLGGHADARVGDLDHHAVAVSRAQSSIDPPSGEYFTALSSRWSSTVPSALSSASTAGRPAPSGRNTTVPARRRGQLAGPVAEELAERGARPSDRSIFPASMRLEEQDAVHDAGARSRARRTIACAALAPGLLVGEPVAGQQLSRTRGSR